MIHAARLHHLGCMLVVDRREEQMLQRRIFMTAFRCVGERVMEGGFQRSSKRRHFDFTPVGPRRPCLPPQRRSEEHTSDIQSIMRNSYAVFCLKKKQPQQTI